MAENTSDCLPKLQYSNFGDYREMAVLHNKGSKAGHRCPYLHFQAEAECLGAQKCEANKATEGFIVLVGRCCDLSGWPRMV